MNILFLVYHGFSLKSGISKKIASQLNGLEANGHKLYLASYEIDGTNERVCIINKTVVARYGKGKWGALHKRCSYSKLFSTIQQLDIDLVYARSFHNATPFTIHFFRKLKDANIPAVLEIPTYPYDQEYNGCPLSSKIELCIDKLFRKKLASLLSGIVTFSNHKTIFGQRTIPISNGVNFDELHLRTPILHPPKEIHLLGVAEVHYWHGYDRLIHGLGLYYQKPQPYQIYFHIVGGIADGEMYGLPQAVGFDKLIKEYQLQDRVIFHGQQTGEALDKLFDQAHFGIGSLARHRTGIEYIKPLKNREYAARGLSFIYSERDEDFENMPYILKAPADETAIEIENLIRFIKQSTLTPKEIRDTISHLSWKEQMKQVITQITLSDSSLEAIGGNIKL
ncbi:MAG: glycosyltransferase family 1 protein [Phocaeicola sp.]